MRPTLPTRNSPHLSLRDSEGSGYGSVLFASSNTGSNFSNVRFRKDCRPDHRSAPDLFGRSPVVMAVTTLKSFGEESGGVPVTGRHETKPAGMGAVLGAGDVLKIPGAIVQLVAVFVVYLGTLWRRADEGNSHHAVKQNVRGSLEAAFRQTALPIAIIINRWLQQSRILEIYSPRSSKAGNLVDPLPAQYRTPLLDFFHSFTSIRQDSTGV